MNILFLDKKLKIRNRENGCCLIEASRDLSDASLRVQRDWSILEFPKHVSLFATSSRASNPHFSKDHIPVRDRNLINSFNASGTLSGIKSFHGRLAHVILNAVPGQFSKMTKPLSSEGKRPTRGRISVWVASVFLFFLFPIFR